MLAVAGSRRSPFFPNVPTLSELGFKAELDIWFGMWSPNGTPAEINARMAREIAKALTQAQSKERYDALGAEPVGLDTSEFKALLASEARQLSTLIRDKNISAE